jgi:hypothetical protein
MRLHRSGFVIVLVLAAGAGAAEARVGTTTSDLALRAGPSANTELLATLPAGTTVQIGRCGRGWCKVAWSGTAGYGRQSGLAVETTARRIAGPVYVEDGELWPIYPPYPYRAGHYPKADWYHKMPPYVAISPSFYRKRFFLTAQERNRYRYMSHVFHGQGDGHYLK